METRSQVDERQVIALVVVLSLGVLLFACSARATPETSALDYMPLVLARHLSDRIPLWQLARVETFAWDGQAFVNFKVGVTRRVR
jgi:hypothetical protein